MNNMTILCHTLNRLYVSSIFNRSVDWLKKYLQVWNIKQYRFVEFYLKQWEKMLQLNVISICGVITAGETNAFYLFFITIKLFHTQVYISYTVSSQFIANMLFDIFWLCRIHYWHRVCYQYYEAYLYIIACKYFFTIYNDIES